jgi:hypothetical protein
VAACVGQNRENPKKIKKYFTLETLPASASHPASSS